MFEKHLPRETKAMRKLKEKKIGENDQLTPTSKRIINKVFRQNDDSNLWPICGDFNATDRAIRRIKNLDYDFDSNYEYATCIAHHVSQIVNSAN
jgi:hypothetical protein